MTTRVASVNMRNTAHPFRITPAQAADGLDKVLNHPTTRVDLVGLQEWAGGPRNAILRRRGTLTRIPALRRWLPLVKPARAADGWTWVRPALGGPTVGAKASRYVPRFVRSRTLAPAGRLERVPGFRALLGASKVTVAGFTDLADGGRLVVLIDGHLTRHVEKGGHYRRGLPRTVARHKREVAQLERVIAYHEARGRRVFVTIDGNYDGLDLEGLVPCWLGHPKAETGGTLGARRPDVIYADDHATEVDVIETISDHDALVATYPR